MIKLSKIKLNPNNPRIIKDEKFKKLCDNISQYPKFLAFRPIVIESWENPIILGGNMRFKALKHLGYKEVSEDWIKLATDFTEDEQKAFVIVDNNNFGEWDWDHLANEWDMNDLANWGIDVPSFDANDQEPPAIDPPATQIIDYLVFDGNKIPITLEEKQLLNKALDLYVEKNSVPLGFAKHLCKTK